MSRKIEISCPFCGKLHKFNESELVGEVPLMDEDGGRIDPPAVEVDLNTFIQCEQCRRPMSCTHATISD